MNPAYSVLLFTTASGAGYGLLALLGFVGFNHGVASSRAFAFTSIIVALALITVGLLSSTLHLGRPERAWRAFSQWRSSWLSREGIAAVLTYPVALVFAAAWSGLIDAPALIAPSGIAVFVMCAITVFCTGKIYASLRTIRAWNHRLTVPVYMVFALATGSAVLMAVATVFGRFQVFQLVLAMLALLALLVLKFSYWYSLDHQPPSFTLADATGLPGEVRQWEVPHTTKNFIMKEMGFVVARNHALQLRKLFLTMLVATGILYAGCLASPWMSLAAAPLLLAAAWLERWLFFAEAEQVASVYYGQPGS